jgi:predicted transcriptional regulator
MNSNENEPHLTAKIASKYVSHHKLAPSELSNLITTVHQAIGQLGQPSEPEEVLRPAVSVRRSVHQDYVVCLDCGYRGKTLRRHITVRHGLSRDEYLRRWGLKGDHPLTAPAYSERRSAMARELGLGREASVQTASPETPAQAPAPVEAEAKPEAKSAPKRRTRLAPKSAAVASEPAAAAKPTRTRRSRRVAQPETLPQRP